MPTRTQKSRGLTEVLADFEKASAAYVDAEREVADYNRHGNQLYNKRNDALKKLQTVKAELDAMTKVPTS